MKKEIHPEYRTVLFVDTTTNAKFLCNSTVQTNETLVHEGEELPVVYVSTSSDSHPTYTGNTQFVDTEGRVDKFLKRYQNKK